MYGFVPGHTLKNLGHRADVGDAGEGQAGADECGEE
jgi:hypothetical protein